MTLKDAEREREERRQRKRERERREGVDYTRRKWQLLRTSLLGKKAEEKKYWT